MAIGERQDKNGGDADEEIVVLDLSPIAADGTLLTRWRGEL